MNNARPPPPPPGVHFVRFVLPLRRIITIYHKAHLTVCLNNISFHNEICREIAKIWKQTNSIFFMLYDFPTGRLWRLI